MKEKLLTIGVTIEDDAKIAGVYDVTGTPDKLKKVVVLLEEAGYTNDSCMFGGVPEKIGTIRVCNFGEDNHGFMCFPVQKRQTKVLGTKLIDELEKLVPGLVIGGAA